MKEEQPDLPKLISLRSKIMKKYGIPVEREPILLFDKNNGKLVKVAEWITADEFNHHIIHCPDIVFYTDKLWILEVDGLIHHTNATVARKDKFRNLHYSTAKLNCIIINEWSIIERDVLIDQPLEASQVFAEFERISEERKIFRKNN